MKIRLVCLVVMILLVAARTAQAIYTPLGVIGDILVDHGRVIFVQADQTLTVLGGIMIARRKRVVVSVMLMAAVIAMLVEGWPVLCYA